jgi:hypothetical protein
MSYYENSFIEQNNTEYNNLEEGYENGDNFYYLTENEHQINGLDENIYNEDNYVEHMEPIRQEQVPQQVPQQVRSFAPVSVTAPQVKAKKVKKEKTKAKLNWLYVLVVILIIALVGYYLIDNKIIKLPSFGSSSSTSSPSASSSSSFKSTLGSTFMSLH